MPLRLRMFPLLREEDILGQQNEMKVHWEYKEFIKIAI